MILKSAIPIMAYRQAHPLQICPKIGCALSAEQGKINSRRKNNILGRGEHMGEKLFFYCVNNWTTCSKAKAWLSQAGVPFTDRNLIKNPPTEEELYHLTKLAQLSLKDLVNTKSQTYKKLNLDISGLEDDEIIRLIQTNPRLLVRPLLFDEQHLIIGFKEDAYQKFLG
jgi:regulatory protein spx